MTDRQSEPSPQDIWLSLLLSPLWVPLYAPLTVPHLAWRAFVLWKIWGWYLTGYLGPASFLAGFGAILAVKVVCYEPRQRSSTPREMRRQIADVVLYPAGLLFVGWIVKLAEPHLAGWVPGYLP